MNSFQVILFFFLFSFGFCLTALLISFFRAKQNPYPEKNTFYECGFDKFPLPEKYFFHINYYSIAILFIILDVEILLLFPWSIHVKELGFQTYLLVMSFFIVLGIGFIYEWKKGVLEPNKS